MAKGQPTRDRTIERLLNAGEIVLGQKGFHGSSVAQICAQAAVSRSAFYANLEDKEELFLLLFDRHSEAQMRRIEEALQTAGSLNIVATLVAALGSLMSERNWALLSAEFTVHAGRRPDIAQRLTARDRQVASRLAALIREVSSRSVWETHGCDRSELLARAVVAAYEGVLTQWIVDPTVDIQGILAIALDHILRSPPGEEP